jgi:hypothetical protein
MVLLEEDVLDAEVPAGPSNAAVKEVDAAASIDDIVEDVGPNNASPTKTHEEEASETEIIESDGLYDDAASEFCAASEATEVLEDTRGHRVEVDHEWLPGEVG